MEWSSPETALLSCIAALSRSLRRRTSGRVTDLFDMDLRAARRDRAFRTGPVNFLYDRAFEDILERIRSVNRRFSSALLVGTPQPSWRRRLVDIVGRVEAIDPGQSFATAADGRQMREDLLDVEPASFDLAIAIGTLDTVNDLAGALLRLRFALMPDSLLIGAVAGGDSLPRLRRAMRAADAAVGTASPHVHPRLEPAGLAQSLTAAGFAMPVVDIDRIRVAYRSFDRLVGDLRGMGATNVLVSRSRVPIPRSAYLAAKTDFEGAGAPTEETFEVLHFAAWSPADLGPDGHG